MSHKREQFTTALNNNRRKQYTTALNNYLAGKIGLPAFYEKAARCGVSEADAEADIIQAKERAASNQVTEGSQDERDQGGEDAAIAHAPKSD